MHDNLDEEQKTFKNRTTKGKKHDLNVDDLDVDEQEQLRNYEEKIKNAIHDNLDNEQKIFENRGLQKKKIKHDNLNVDEKEQLRNYEEKK